MTATRDRSFLCCTRLAQSFPLQSPSRQTPLGMKPALSEKDLKAAITSSLRRQHLLGAVPPAQRFLPLAALAIGDVLAQGSGTNVIESLLCGSNSTESQISLSHLSKEFASNSAIPRSTIVESCRTCWHRYDHRQTVVVPRWEPNEWLRSTSASYLSLGQSAAQSDGNI